MTEDYFMESFSTKEVHSFIGSHIKDLAFVKSNLNDKTFNEFEKTWDLYAQVNRINEDNFIGWWRGAKVQVVNCEKGLKNNLVKQVIESGIGYDQACPSRFPKLMSGLFIRMHEELNYYYIHVNKYIFYENIAHISHALERKFKNLSKLQMCDAIITEQIKLLTSWKMQFANYVYFDRIENKPKANHTFYFAYGINCNRSKMLERCPSAKKIGQANLYNHKFIIDERGPNGGCASVKENEGSDVTGVLWHIRNDEIIRLDKAEGINLNPPVYKKEIMKVHVLGSGSFECEALVYISLKPEGYFARQGYIEGILKGIKEDLVQNLNEKSYRCHIKFN